MVALREFPWLSRSTLAQEARSTHRGRDEALVSSHSLQICTTSSWGKRQSQENLKKRLIHHLYPNGSHLSISSLHLPPKFQTHVSTAYSRFPLGCLLKTCFIHSPLTIFINGNSILQMFRPSKAKTLETPLSLPYVQSISKLSWPYLQNISQIGPLLTSTPCPSHTTSSRLDGCHYLLTNLPAYSLIHSSLHSPQRLVSLLKCMSDNVALRHFPSPSPLCISPSQLSLSDII